MLRRLFPTAALAVALVGAGCGDDGDDKARPATQATTVSPAQAQAYRRHVQGVIRTVDRVGKRLSAQLRTIASLSDAARALEAYRLGVQGAANQLETGRPPRRAADGARDFAAILREIGGATAPSVRAARGGDRVAFNRAFRAFRAQLSGPYRRRLSAAGHKIDRALAAR